MGDIEGKKKKKEKRQRGKQGRPLPKRTEGGRRGAARTGTGELSAGPLKLSASRAAPTRCPGRTARLPPRPGHVRRGPGVTYIRSAPRRGLPSGKRPVPAAGGRATPPPPITRATAARPLPAAARFPRTCR